MAVKKIKSFDEIMAELQKDYGEDRLALASAAAATEPEVIPTGVATLDQAIKAGGLPIGRLTVITGPPDVGKTSLALTIAAKIQRDYGGKVIYQDSERKLHRRYMKAIGVDTKNNFWVAYSRSIEASFELLAKVAESMRATKQIAPLLYVYDSIHMTQSQMEADAKLGKQLPGSRAAAYARLWPKIIDSLHGIPVIMLFISQERIGGIGTPFSYIERVGGGGATRYQPSLVIAVRGTKVTAEEKREEILNCKATIIRNKVGKPHGEAFWRIHWGKGIDLHDALIRAGHDIGVIEKSTGGRYSTILEDGEPIKWTGEKGWKKLVEERPDIPEKIQEAIDVKRNRKSGKKTKKEKKAKASKGSKKANKKKEQ